ncbi:MAG: hypothetical protein IKC07_02020 [Clostridia bacterium]|nr:hypothetical protein [Clostridia bacterium]
MNEIKLLGKKVIIDKSPILLKYSPSDDWKDYWDVKSGNWSVEDGWLIGDEPGNKGGILFSKEFYEDNVMMTFSVKTALPATRDLNAVFCAHWDEETDYLGTSYVCGLNGWYENKSGIERNEVGCESALYSTTTLYKYEPGTLVRMTFGAIDGQCFMVVDDTLITELIDPNPIKGGHIGFSAYCTKLMIKDIEIRKIHWEKFIQTYKPEY